MRYSPGVLTGFTVVMLAAAGSPSVGAWQPDVVYPGIRQADAAGYRLTAGEHDGGGFTRSFAPTVRYAEHRFRPLNKGAQAPDLVQGYRFRQTRRSAYSEMSPQPADYSGTWGLREYVSDPATPERSYSTHYYRNGEGRAPVLRPKNNSKRLRTRPVFREISGTRYGDETLEFRLDQAEFKFADPELTTPGVSEVDTVPAGAWRWSSTAPSLHDNYRLWQFPRRR